MLQTTRDSVHIVASARGSAPPASTLIAYTSVYILLLVTFIVFAVRIIHKGPNLNLDLPTYGRKAQEVNP